MFDEFHAEESRRRHHFHGSHPHQGHHSMHGHGGGGGRGRGRVPGHGGEGREDAGRRMGRGQFGMGGRGGGSGRVFGPGDLRLVLLALIEEKPRHGYELIKELEQKFGGGYAPSPGSVYPTLTLLEELEQVRSVSSVGTKRLFEITEEGRKYLRDNEAAMKSAMARMEMAARAVSGDSPPEDLHHAMHTLKAALRFHRGGWSAKETERVRKILEDAATRISDVEEGSDDD
jgi:DNA-binding PadR family transcriptional regulator